jgi:hypothetical protein
MSTNTWLLCPRREVTGFFSGAFYKKLFIRYTSGNQLSRDHLLPGKVLLSGAAYYLAIAGNRGHSISIELPRDFLNTDPRAAKNPDNFFCGLLDFPVPLH